MMIEDVIKKSILPLAFMLFWFWMVSTIMKVSGQTDLFWWIFLSGLPFGIHKMRLVLIPKGMDITATLGMAALSVIIGALIGSIMIPVYVIRKMEYMPVDCLQVPKMLFQVEEFKNLSNTAKFYTAYFWISAETGKGHGKRAGKTECRDGQYRDHGQKYQVL